MSLLRTGLPEPLSPRIVPYTQGQTGRADGEGWLCVVS